MSELVAIVGCGGHGREVFGVIRAINETQDNPFDVVGFLDDAPTRTNLERVSRIGARFIGPVSYLADMAAETRYVIGIGDPGVRASVAEKIGSARRPATPLIHPFASVGLDNRLAGGTILFPGARVTTNVTLGQHVHLNQNATVGHDSVLQDCVSLSPLAAVSGDCHLGKAALIGTNATVLQGLTVGPGATVGAGACVVKAVPSRSIVKGVPAR